MRVAGERIVGRIDPTLGVGRLNAPRSQELSAQRHDGIGHLELAVVVGVARVRAGGRLAPKEIHEDGERIADIDQAVGVGVAAEDARL